jgi:FAD/FMN-containing dehydrogenase/Fe-S oxidoreductase
MSHQIEIDHRRSAPRHPPYLARRTPVGRVVSEYEASLRPEQARELARALARSIAGEVRFDGGTRALYATDASSYRQVPIGVVVPKSVDDVIAAVDLCRKFAAPLVLRGGGTSLAGQGCNVAVLIDFSKFLTRILELDPDRRIARVEPGCVLDELRDAAERHGLTFGPDPATHDHNTLGGMIGNNSCGVHSVLAGRTSDNVEALEILTYDGVRMHVGPTSEEQFRSIVSGGGRQSQIYRDLDDFRRRYAGCIREKYPNIPRRISGYENLDQLFAENGFNVARALVGTEATCVTVLAATLRLIPSPRARVLAILGFPDVFVAADHVPEVLEYAPIALEGIDEMFIEFIKRKHIHESEIEMLPDGRGWLLAEFGAQSAEEAAEPASRLVRDFEAKGFSGALVRDPGKQAKLWAVRESGLPATAKIPDWPETYEGWEDSAVPRERLGAYLRDLKALFHRHGYESAVYGHFGGGLVHCRIDCDMRTEEGLRNWRSFLDHAAELVIRHGGSLSGEHGDGQSRGELLEKMYGPELVEAFREFKAIWDPDWKMNPGKVVDPYPITSNLRAGPEYQPEDIKGYFAYPQDRGSFTAATQRCVGVGLCRRRSSAKGVMCPSYMATLEEKHSTRGRARLLFEMLRRGPIDDGWRSRAVEEALDLCLGCKGCKHDCPVNVDMATYKAEFRARHYRGRLRPRAAYSMGLIHEWSRLAAAMPETANALLQAPGLSRLGKWLGGISQRRAIPRYSPVPFVEWFRARSPKPRAGPRVLLWPDTFNNYFRSATAIAAAQVLETLGFRVAIPDRPLCCGRPLYDWGMLDRAKELWREVMTSLRTEIERGTPVVGLEPACVSAFRDELVGLFPDDALARRLSDQTLLLSEFLDREMSGASLPRMAGAALVQLHCHHHAVLNPQAEARMLQRIGIDAEILASGCCGMAGAFGFEAEKYEVSMRAAERVLLPRVRSAAADTLVLADGFSCREQIEQATGRKTLHIAELLASLYPPQMPR